MPDARIVCKVCFMPVSRIWGADGPNDSFEESKLIGWVHLDRPASEPHDPEPMSAEEADIIDQVCDFCSAPNIAWVFPTDPTRRQVAPHVFVEDTAWAACQDCHDDVVEPGMTSRKLAERVSSRAVPEGKDMDPRLKEFLLQQWESLYVEFMEHRHDPTPLQEWVS